MYLLFLALLANLSMSLFSMEERALELDNWTWKDNQDNNNHDSNATKNENLSNEDLSLEEKCKLLMLLKVPNAKIPLDQLYELDLSCKGSWSYNKLEDCINIELELNKYLPKYTAQATQSKILRSFVQVCSLKFSGHSFRQLPDEIGQLTSLKILNVSHNLLTTLTPAIGYLTQLSILNVSNNQLKTLPSSMGNLFRLQELKLEKNPLQTLPDSVTKLTSLKALEGIYVDSKLLLPEGLEKLPYLSKCVKEAITKARKNMAKQ